MRFFIDTAKVEDIKKANDMGVICGVTTNPSLIAKEGRDFKEVIKEITSIVDGPISGEVKATTVDATYVIAAADKTFFAPSISSLYNILLSSRHAMALREALNSTGSVMIVNTTDNPKNIIPSVINVFPMLDAKLNKRPININGIESLEPILAKGTIKLLSESGA